jgi:5-methylcytosine-specific restriction enzyme A
LPRRIERPCRAYLCPNTTSNPNGYCDEHQELAKKRKADRRVSAYQRGYDKRWERFRARYLREHPLCVDCRAKYRLTPATEVHHIRKLKDYPQLKYAEDNLMALCHKCHSKRTARGE